MKQTLQLKQTTNLKPFQIQSLNLLLPATAELDELIKQQLNENYCLSIKDNSYKPNQETIDFVLESITQQKTLLQDLEQQIYLNTSDIKLSNTTLSLLDYLDDNGLFTINKDLLLQNLKIKQPLFEQCLTLLQSCNPKGVGAFSVTECLTLQLQEVNTPISRLAQTILQNHSDFSKQINKLASKLKISQNEIQKAVKLIKTLTPTPNYKSDTQEFIIQPEIIINQENDTLSIIQSRQLPELIINPQYIDILENKKITKDDAELIKQKIILAKEFIKNLQRRYLTLSSITQIIIDNQKKYFSQNFDDQFLKPLTLKQIANKLELHSSTISRAIRNKYIELPNKKVLSFKHFISININKNSLSRQAIKQIIKEIISQESSSSPLSDQAIVDYLLLNHSVELSRRVIAKYRDELSISNSSKRKF